MLPETAEQFEALVANPENADDFDKIALRLLSKAMIEKNPDDFVEWTGCSIETALFVFAVMCANAVVAGDFDDEEFLH